MASAPASSKTAITKGNRVAAAMITIVTSEILARREIASRMNRMERRTPSSAHTMPIRLKVNTVATSIVSAIPTRIQNRNGDASVIGIARARLAPRAIECPNAPSARGTPPRDWIEPQAWNSELFAFTSTNGLKCVRPSTIARRATIVKQTAIAPWIQSGSTRSGAMRPTT